MGCFGSSSILTLNNLSEVVNTNQNIERELKLQKKEYEILRLKLELFEKNDQCNQQLIKELKKIVNNNSTSIKELENKFKLMDDEKNKMENDILNILKINNNNENEETESYHNDDNINTNHVQFEEPKLNTLNSQHEVEFEEKINNNNNNNTTIYSIGELFSLYHSHNNNDMQYMNKESLMKCLSYFGINSLNESKQNAIWELFDLDKAQEITISDFQATLSSFISGNDNDTLKMLFEIFDDDNDNNLNINNLSNLLFTLHQIALIFATHHHILSPLTKSEAFKQAQMMLDFNKSSHDKLSFEQFRVLYGDRRVSKFVTVRK